MCYTENKFSNYTYVVYIPTIHKTNYIIYYARRIQLGEVGVTITLFSK
jgi:hypothetical protein